MAEPGPSLMPRGISRPAFLRMVVQVWLSWQAVVMLPFLVYLVFRHTTGGEHGWGVPAKLAFLLLPLCVVALVASIFAPVSWFRRPILGWVLIVFLLLGCVWDVVLFRIAFSKEAPQKFNEYRLFIGPIIVAVWNLARLVRARWFLPGVAIWCACTGALSWT